MCTDLMTLDDTILENNENFTVILSSQSNQVIITSGREQASVVINEDNMDSKSFLLAPALAIEVVQLDSCSTPLILSGIYHHM